MRAANVRRCAQVIRLTQSGSSSNVDMLVGDIYGGDCNAIGLKGASGTRIEPRLYAIAV